MKEQQELNAFIGLTLSKAKMIGDDLLLEFTSGMTLKASAAPCGIENSYVFLYVNGKEVA